MPASMQVSSARSRAIPGQPLDGTIAAESEASRCRSEAQRCRRLAFGVGDPATMALLEDMAEEYEAKARRIDSTH